MTAEESPTGLLRHLLVPVANEADARTTARTLSRYSPGQVTVLHVVEKGEGVPDKKPLEQSERIAADSFAAFRAEFPDAHGRIAYARDVVGEIFDVADDVGASAIVYRARDGDRLARFLSGDRSLKLVTNADRPVVALPRRGPNG